MNKVKRRSRRVGFYSDRRHELRTSCFRGRSVALLVGAYKFLGSCVQYSRYHFLAGVHDIPLSFWLLMRFLLLSVDTGTDTLVMRCMLCCSNAAINVPNVYPL